MSALVAALPFTATQANDAFWGGNDFSATTDSNGDPIIVPEVQQDIHNKIKDNLPDLFDFTRGIGPNRMPPGEWVDNGDRGVRIHDPDKAWEGYTLLNSFSPTSGVEEDYTVLIDMYGNIVHSWDHPVESGFWAVGKMLPGGDLVGGLVGPVEPPGFGQMDWCGNLVHQWPGVTVHHDHQREGSNVGYYAPGEKAKVKNAKSLVLSWHYPEGTPIAPSPLEDDLVREIDWDGTVLFEWKASDHYLEMGLDDAALKAIWDTDSGNEGIGEPNTVDWSHANAVSWVGPNKWWNDYGDRRFHPDNIVMDFRSLNNIIIIARDDHPDGDWIAGEVVWRMGPDYGTHGDDGKVGQIIGQHQAHIIPQTLPGAGNLLVFDNGGGAGYGELVKGFKDVFGDPLVFWPNKYRHYSRVLEINPITRQIVWEYKQPNPSHDADGDGYIRGNEKLFYSNILSGAQRLKNGNTLITEGDTGRIFEVTMDGDVAWEYAPDFNYFPPFIFAQAVYRATRIPERYLPKTRTCPE